MQALLATLGKRPLRTVLGLSLALFLSGNWLLPLLDRDEPRFAEASREMTQRQDWIVPWLNGAQRLDKPPLIYWCQIGCFQLFGQTAFAARLPSALFGSATAGLLVLWGRRLGNPIAGFYAGLLFTTCLQVLIHARLSVADMPMVFFFTLAVWSGWEMSQPRPTKSPWWWWLFFISLALGFLAKGPVAWLPLGGLLLARVSKAYDFRLPWRRFLPGPVVTLAIVGVWGIPALVATRGEFFTTGIGRHVVYRSFAILEGHGGRGWLGFVLTLPLYPITFFLSFFPWSLKVRRAFLDWWKTRREDKVGRYLWTQTAVVFAVFTLVRTKLPHYTLPAFPSIALWLGLQLANAKDSTAAVARRVLAMSAVTLCVTLALFPLAGSRFLTTNLWQQVRPHAAPNMSIAVVEFGEPSLIWESRQILTNYVQFISPPEAETFLQGRPPRVLILPTRQAGELPPSLLTNNTVVRASGIDTVQFKHWDMTAVIRP